MVLGHVSGGRLVIVCGCAALQGHCVVIVWLLRGRGCCVVVIVWWVCGCIVVMLCIVCGQCVIIVIGLWLWLGWLRLSVLCVCCVVVHSFVPGWCCATVIDWLFVGSGRILGDCGCRANWLLPCCGLVGGWLLCGGLLVVCWSL